MAAKKIAISVPEEIIAEVDRAAADAGTTRSGFITSVLRRIASARSDAEITRRVNAFFTDPEMLEEQARTTRAYEELSASAGTEW